MVPVTEVTRPWQEGLAVTTTSLWDTVVCLWTQHALRLGHGLTGLLFLRVKQTWAFYFRLLPPWRSLG